MNNVAQGPPIIRTIPVTADAPASSLPATAVSFTQSGAGAMARTVQGKAGEWVGVTDFFANGVSGAAVDPTGVLDSTLGIQAAFNTGLNVYFVPGTFKITASLSMSSNQTVLIPDGATITGNFSDYLFKMQGTTGAALSSVTGAISTLADNFTMADASGLSTNDMFILYDVVANRYDVNIVDYKVGNQVFTFYPIAYNFATAANIRVYKLTPVQRAIINGNGKLTNSNAGGGAISWLYSRDCVVSGINIQDNAYIGCIYQNSIGGTFTDNLVQNNGFSGIGLRGAKGCHIARNRLFNNRADEPITLFRSNTHNVIQGNVVVQEMRNGAGTAGNAILLDTDNYFNSILGNTCEGTPTYSILVTTNGSYNTIIGNNINRALLGSVKIAGNSNYNIVDKNICSNVILAADTIEGGSTYAIRVKSDCSFNHIGTNIFFGLAGGSVLDAQTSVSAGYLSQLGLGTTSPAKKLEIVKASAYATESSFAFGAKDSDIANYDTGIWGGVDTTQHFAFIQSMSGGSFTNRPLALQPNGGDIRWGQALVALGGGAAPTLGTIGGSGPATSAQNSWMRVVDSTGAAFWVPVWK